jgi:hypothetical protein
MQESGGKNATPFRLNCQKSDLAQENQAAIPIEPACPFWLVPCLAPSGCVLPAANAAGIHMQEIGFAVITHATAMHRQC